MRVVLLSETFAPNMGYIGSMLPKYLARLGMDTHVIAADLPPYYNALDTSSRTIDFVREQTLAAGTVARVDGYTVHILPHGRAFGYVFMRDLASKLRELAPHVVYSLTAIGWTPLQAAAGKISGKYALFTGSHTAASTFPLARRRGSAVEIMKCLAMRWLPGRLVSLLTTACYAPTGDCAEIAWRFFGVQKRKVKLVHLGVDTDLFYPSASPVELDERARLRSSLGFLENEIVCVCTGKLVAAKNPMIVLEAVERLRAMGKPFRALFIGDGGLADALRARATVLGFMPVKSLAPYYRAADIAVWPTNESTSMLDAAACGLPLVVSDQIYRDHVEGNGLTYRLNDLQSLVDALLTLEGREMRATLGAAGADKMRSLFSWSRAARIRVEDFANALRSSTGPHPCPPG
jgi:glycosyltransferase involved in cell wall biosynthesis